MLIHNLHEFALLKKKEKKSLTAECFFTKLTLLRSSWKVTIRSDYKKKKKILRHSSKRKVQDNVYTVTGP